MANFFIHDKAIVETNAIGDESTIWAFTHILKGAVIGKNANINDHCFIENDVVIGDRVTIKCGVQIWDGIEIEDDVFIGPNATFTNDKFPRSKIYPEQFAKILVKSGASLGANCTILPGITIGTDAMIGAGAVVTKDVKNFALMVGNPSKQIGWVSEFGQTLELDINGFAICPESGEKYQLEYGELYKIENT